MLATIVKPMREGSVLDEKMRGIPFFKDTNDEELLLLHNAAEFITMKRFEILFHRGDDNTSLYYVTNGMMKVSSHVNHGKEVIRSICHEGMLLGEGSLINEKRHTATAQSLDRQTSIVKIEAMAVRSVMASNPKVGMRLFDYIGRRLVKCEHRLESVITEDARTRVINFLKDNAELYGNKVGLNELLLRHNFTQQDIADFTGTSRQTVTTILNDLKRSNVITMNRRRILIRDVALFG